MITIKATGGLCNRMRAIDSALALNNSFGNKGANVIWEENSDLGCRFEDLFKSHKDLHVVNTTSFSYKDLISTIGYYNTHDPNLIKNPIKKLLKSINAGENKYSAKLYVNDISNILKGSKDFTFLEEVESVYITSYSRFYPRNNPYKEFQPTSEIMKTINKVTKDFSDNTIGVHIRRTDNIKSIQYSPLEQFIEVMNMEVGKNNDINFFLATDDPSTENQLRERFGDKIITYKKTRCRTTKIGMQDAVVDLYALSRTNKIYGSFWSSFSETAAEISGIELIQVLKDA